MLKVHLILIINCLETTDYISENSSLKKVFLMKYRHGCSHGPVQATKWQWHHVKQE